MNHGSILQHNLKTLVNKRFSVLSRRLKHTKGAHHFNPYRDVINEAVLSAIRQEVLAVFNEAFGNDLKQGKDTLESNGGADCGCSCKQGGMSLCATSRYPMPEGYFGTGQMEATIDQMVAETLMHGRQTSSVLRALFGLVPMLIGR